MGAILKESLGLSFYLQLYHPYGKRSSPYSGARRVKITPHEACTLTAGPLSLNFAYSELAQVALHIAIYAGPWPTVYDGGQGATS
jgi:hypothetical protein